MKTKLFCILGTVLASVAISVVSLSNNSHKTKYSLLSTNIDVLAASECRSSSDGNQGVCEAEVNGTGDVCVKSHWYQFNNCSETINR